MADRHCQHSLFRPMQRLGSALILSIVAACGQEPDSPSETPTTDVANLQESIAHGRLVAFGGPPAGPENACFSCHGIHGQGDAAAAVPRLAGLSAHYIAKQLTDYANGSRRSDVMEPIAKSLAAFDRQALGLFYQHLTVDPAKRPPTLPQDPALVQRGALLYAIGAKELRLQGCVNCHGPGGRGLPPAYPAVAGQPSSYTAAQLRDWKEGERKNDMANVMAQVAARMSDRDIEAAAAYLAELQP